MTKKQPKFGPYLVDGDVAPEHGQRRHREFPLQTIGNRNADVTDDVFRAVVDVFDDVGVGAVLVDVKHGLAAGRLWHES